MGGVTYVTNLVRALAALPKDERPDVSVVEQPDTDWGLYSSVAPLVRIVPWPETRPRTIVGRMKLAVNPTVFHDMQAKQLRESGAECLFPCKTIDDVRRGVSWIGWAVDFQHRHFPEFFPLAQIERKEALLRELADSASLVVTSSKCVKRDFGRFLPQAAAKARVLRFHTVPDQTWFESDPAETVQRYRLPGRYLMVPNQFFVHKNHRCVFAALRIIRDRGLDAHVVCTGRTEDTRSPEYVQDLFECVSAAGIRPYVHVLGLIPRFDQIQIMRAATAVLQPSFFEGWSTVVEDARCLGKRIFLSDIPVHREQAPPNAVYFEPSYPESLADGLAQQWPDLRPGGDFLAEAAARDAQRDLVIEFGRNFVRIARHVTGDRTDAKERRYALYA